VFTAERLQHDLRDRVGAECDPAVVAESIGRRYRFLGYVPSIEAECAEGELRVTVRESSHRIDLIAFDAAELSRLGVAPAPGFVERLRLYPVPEGAQRALLRGLLQTREGDLYNHERYRSDSEALRSLGYTIAFIPGPVPASGEYPPGAYLIQSLQPPVAGERRRGRTHYLGATARYGPRERSSVGAVYQKRELFGRFDRFLLSPSFNAALGGDLSYAAPILADRQDPRRLYDLEVGLFSDLRHNRLLEDIETDERRSGASVALGIRPLLLRAPHDLRHRLGIRHERVALEDAVPGQEERDLTTLELSAVHEWRHTYRWPSLTARLAPTLEVAVDAAGGDSSFVRTGVDGTIHARTPAGIELDLHLVGGSLDREVPAYELWSLGGATTVRGFREDAFLGRHLTALQIEAWFPFVRPLESRPITPGTSPADAAQAPVEPRVGRLFKWAVFVDGGTISGIPGGGRETLHGAGLGLRFVVPRRPLVVRLDYGRGLGEPGGDWFPYLSLGYRF
jgi:outer membrane protein assembly factor BamA